MRTPSSLDDRDSDPGTSSPPARSTGSGRSLTVTELESRLTPASLATWSTLESGAQALSPDRTVYSNQIAELHTTLKSDPQLVASDRVVIDSLLFNTVQVASDLSVIAKETEAKAAATLALSRIDPLVIALDQAKTTLTEAEKQLSAVSTELTLKRQEVPLLDRVIASLTAMQTTLRQEIADMEKKGSVATTAPAPSKNPVVRMLQQSAAQQERRLAVAPAKEKPGIQKTINALNQQILRMDPSLKNPQKENPILTGKRTELANVTTEITRLTAERTALLTLIASLELQEQTAKTAIAAAKQEIARLDLALAEAKKEASALDVVHASAVASVAALSDPRATLEQTLRVNLTASTTITLPQTSSLSVTERIAKIFSAVKESQQVSSVQEPEWVAQETAPLVLDPLQEARLLETLRQASLRDALSVSDRREAALGYAIFKQTVDTLEPKEASAKAAYEEAYSAYVNRQGGNYDLSIYLQNNLTAAEKAYNIVRYGLEYARPGLAGAIAALDHNRPETLPEQPELRVVGVQGNRLVLEVFGTPGAEYSVGIPGEKEPVRIADGQYSTLVSFYITDRIQTNSFDVWLNDQAGRVPSEPICVGWSPTARTLFLTEKSFPGLQRRGSEQGASSVSAADTAQMDVLLAAIPGTVNLAAPAYTSIQFNDGRNTEVSYEIVWEKLGIPLNINDVAIKQFQQQYPEKWGTVGSDWISAARAYCRRIGSQEGYEIAGMQDELAGRVQTLSRSYEGLIHATSDYFAYLLGVKMGADPGYDLRRLDTGIPFFPQGTEIAAAVRMHFTDIALALGNYKEQETLAELARENYSVRMGAVEQFEKNEIHAVEVYVTNIQNLPSATGASIAERIATVVGNLDPTVMQKLKDSIEAGTYVGSLTPSQQQLVAQGFTLYYASAVPVSEEERIDVRVIAGGEGMGGSDASVNDPETIRSMRSGFSALSSESFRPFYDQAMLWYQESSSGGTISVNGTVLNTASAAGKILAGIYQDIFVLPREQRLQRLVIVERILGLDAQVLWQASIAKDYKVFFSALQEEGKRVGLNHLFDGSALPTDIILRPVTSNALKNAFSASWDLPSDGKTFEEAAIRITAINGKAVPADKQLVTRTTSQYSASVSALSIPYLAAGLALPIQGDIVLSVQLSVKMQNTPALQKSFPAFRIHLDIPEITVQENPQGNLSTLPEGDPNREQQNRIISALMMPVEGAGWVSLIGSDKHDGRNLFALDLSKESDTGTAIRMAATGYINYVNIADGRVVVEHVTSNGEVWYSQYEHMTHILESVTGVSYVSVKDAAGLSAAEQTAAATQRSKAQEAINAYIIRAKTEKTPMLQGTDLAKLGNEGAFTTGSHSHFAVYDAQNRGVNLYRWLDVQQKGLVHYASIGVKTDMKFMWSDSANALLNAAEGIAMQRVSMLNEAGQVTVAENWAYAAEAGKSIFTMERVVWVEDAGRKLRGWYKVDSMGHLKSEVINGAAVFSQWIVENGAGKWVTSTAL